MRVPTTHTGVHEGPAIQASRSDRSCLTGSRRRARFTLELNERRHIGQAFRRSDCSQAGVGVAPTRRESCEVGLRCPRGRWSDDSLGDATALERLGSRSFRCLRSCSAQCRPTPGSGVTASPFRCLLGSGRDEITRLGHDSNGQISWFFGDRGGSCGGCSRAGASCPSRCASNGIPGVGDFVGGHHPWSDRAARIEGLSHRGAR